MLAAAILALVGAMPANPTAFDRTQFQFPQGSQVVAASATMTLFSVTGSGLLRRVFVVDDNRLRLTVVADGVTVVNDASFVTLGPVLTNATGAISGMRVARVYCPFESSLTVTVRNTSGSNLTVTYAGEVAAS